MSIKPPVNDGEGPFISAARSSNRAAADSAKAEQVKKFNAGKEIYGNDKFAENAASPEWTGGFDQKLNTPRFP